MVVIEGLCLGTAFVGCLILGWERASVGMNMSGHGQPMNTGLRVVFCAFTFEEFEALLAIDRVALENC